MTGITFARQRSICVVTYVPALNYLCHSSLRPRIQAMRSIGLELAGWEALFLSWVMYRTNVRNLIPHRQF